MVFFFINILYTTFHHRFLSLNKRRVPMETMDAIGFSHYHHLENVLLKTRTKNDDIDSSQSKIRCFFRISSEI